MTDEQKVSDVMREKWNLRYVDSSAGEKPPSEVVADYGYLLPQAGTALDLACGLGGNAVYLAQQGLDVSAWDFSDVAISSLTGFAQTAGLSIRAEVRDAELNPPKQNRFDVITVSYFLSRDLFPLLIAALRPGGLIYYQTYTVEKIPGSPGPSNPEFLLAPNELLDAFGDLRVLAYREEGQVGDITRGIRNIAQLVARKS